MIRLNNLNKYYNKNKSNEIHVINDISLELPNSGLISFLGASGSGKTTLLNVIGGLDKAQGNISYDSFEMKKYEMTKIDRFRNENFGYVFQTYNLLLNETVYDNLKIALELIDIHDEVETNSRIDYALKSVGMYKYRKKKASQLSGGQQQRVAIARALVKHCKVIIADEPTGNLDSANAIEVMNILKSISRKTLVLLVTHNESLANFYSDYIYKIEDGKIINSYENVNDVSLSNTNDNIIYLKDIDSKELNQDGISVKLYSDKEKDISLEIVERNNTFYIRSNKKIKLLENSNIELRDDHYKPVEKETINEYDYDDSFFNNSLKKKNVFQDFFNSLKHSFQMFIKPTKKIKVIYISLLLLGILFAICAISIANAIKVDTSTINCDDNYFILSNEYSFYMSEDFTELKENLISENISNIQMVYTKSYEFTYQVNFVEKKRHYDSFGEMYYNNKVNSLLYGKEPQINEIAISLGVADLLLEKFGDSFSSYEDLFKLTIEGGQDFKIVGIVDSKYKMVYLHEKDYLESVTSYIYVMDDHQRYYDVEKKYDTYEIVSGRDLNDADLNTANILISDKNPEYDKLLDTEIPGIGYVVGVYKMKDVEYNSKDIILNVDHPETINAAYKYSYEVENYVLIEGRKPEKENECLISIYSNKEVGQVFDGYKIVGRYNANTQLLRANVLLSTSALSIDEYAKKVFLIGNEDKLLESIASTNFELKNSYEHEIAINKTYNKETMAIYGILGSICLIAASIMVLFLMRSKMINDIYNIGVYRSLGSSKFKIYLKYFSDIVVMVTFTSLIAYFIIMFVYLSAIESINDYFGSELFSRGLVVPLLGVLVLYLVNIFFGLLPIYTLLKKTPAEILAKYDI